MKILEVKRDAAHIMAKSFITNAFGGLNYSVGQLLLIVISLLSFSFESPKTQLTITKDHNVGNQLTILDFKKYQENRFKDLLIHPAYSYQDIDFAFVKNTENSFISGPRIFVEQMMLERIPKSLRARAQKYIRSIFVLSELHKVDPLWVISVMWTESHFKYTAKSPVGALGLMQIMPATRRHIYYRYKSKGHKLVVESKNFKLSKYFKHSIAADEQNRFKRKLANIELGIIYLKSLLKRFDSNYTYATVAYNMGPGWTARRLKNKQPVGAKNQYLNKVTRAYSALTQNI